MELVRFSLDMSYGGYSYKEASSISMSIIGNFLLDDVGCGHSSFREWGLRDDWTYCAGNITGLEKENGIIYLRDLYPEEEIPTIVEMTVSQFVQLLDEWEEKVCKKKPAEVIIKHDDGKFWIETSE